MKRITCSWVASVLLLAAVACDGPRNHPVDPDAAGASNVDALAGGADAPAGKGDTAAPGAGLDGPVSPGTADSAAPPVGADATVSTVGNDTAAPANQDAGVVAPDASVPVAADAFVYMDAAVKPPLGCTPKTTRCNAGNPEICDNNGIWTVSTHDCTSPTATISPADGEDGVKSDVEITVTFSEPMKDDAAATKLAFISPQIPEATFRWNDQKTVLWIKPTKALEYASGTDDTVVAKSYTVTIGDRLTDAAGNALKAKTVTFKTLRRIAADCPVVLDLSGYSLKMNGNDPSSSLSSKNFPIYADLNTAEASETRGFVSFNTSALPKTLVTVEKAILRMYEATGGTKDGPLSVVLEHVSYGAVGPESFFANPLEATSPIDLPNGAGPGFREIDVTKVLPSDFRPPGGNRGLSQYRLRMLTTERIIAFRPAKSGPEDDAPILKVSVLAK